MGLLLEVSRFQIPYDMNIYLNMKYSEKIRDINGRESEAKSLLSCVHHLMLLLYRKALNSLRNRNTKKVSIFNFHAFIFLMRKD